MGVYKVDSLKEGIFTFQQLFGGMKIGPFLAGIEPKTLKRPIMGSRFWGRGIYWEGVFIGGFKVNRFFFSLSNQ